MTAPSDIELRAERVYTAAEVIGMLITIAQVAHHALDDAEVINPTLAYVNHSALEQALDALDELPDDRPGYTMSGAMRAEWALRGLFSAQHPIDPSAAPAEPTEALQAAAQPAKPTDAELLAVLSCTNQITAHGDEPGSVEYFSAWTDAGRYQAGTVRDLLTEVWSSEHTPDPQDNPDHYAEWLSKRQASLATPPKAAQPLVNLPAGTKLPRHQFWGAGEPDCPADLKAPNGELHTTRCKFCGDGWRKSKDVCLFALQRGPVAEAIDWVDDFIARCNGNDRGACEAVNVLRAALAANPPKGESTTPAEPTRAAFETAMRQTWKMIDPLHPPGTPGSYARGEHNGIAAALNTLRENFERIAAPAQPAEPAQPTPPAAQEPLSAAARDVFAERQRQITAEGWTPEHDDSHADGSLAEAGACYAMGDVEVSADNETVAIWPWSLEWWKPEGGRRRMLVKAGALILAEIERLDRAKAEDSKCAR